MKPIKFLSTLLATLIVMNGVMLTPAVVPIIIPRATAGTIFGCQSQATGTIAVIDADGRTYTLICGADLHVAAAYPGQFPSEDAPWLVVITARPRRSLLPQICFLSVTRLPVHLQCAADDEGHAAVDFDLILTMDQGGS